MNRVYTIGWWWPCSFHKKPWDPDPVVFIQYRNGLSYSR